MRRIGDILLGLGLLLGTAAVVGYELDIVPTLPPEVLKIIIYKLTFVGGLGLLVAGAFVRRLASRTPEIPPRASIPHGAEPSALPEGEPQLRDISPKVDASLEKLRREP